MSLVRFSPSVVTVSRLLLVKLSVVQSLSHSLVSLILSISCLYSAGNCRLVTVHCERFEPRSHFKSRLSLIIWVNVVLNRTVVVDSDVSTICAVVMQHATLSQYRVTVKC